MLLLLCSLTAVHTTQAEELERIRIEQEGQAAAWEAAEEARRKLRERLRAEATERARNRAATVVQSAHRGSKARTGTATVCVCVLAMCLL